MANKKKKFVSGIFVRSEGAKHSDFKHQGSFYKTTERYVRVIGDQLHESDDETAPLDSWTPCEKLPF